MSAPGSPVPVWLPPAVKLAHWTQTARASDSVASTRLRLLATGSAWMVQHSHPAATHGTELGGVEVGVVPQVPSDSDVETWARAAWERAIAAGLAAERALRAHAGRLLAQGEVVLTRVSRALAAERDATVRATLEAVEAGLTAILRPLARGIATATGPIAGPALLIGVGLLLFFMGGSSRR